MITAFATTAMLFLTENHEQACRDMLLLLPPNTDAVCVMVIEDTSAEYLESSPIPKVRPW